MDKSSSQNDMTACTSSNSTTFSAYLGNLRSDLSVEELSNKLQFLLGTVGITVLVRDIQVHRKSWKKPSFAFVVLKDKDTFDLVVKNLNRAEDDEIVFTGKELVISSAHEQSPQPHSKTKPLIKTVRKNSKKVKHKNGNYHKSADVTMETSPLTAHRISTGEKHNSLKNDQNIQDSSIVPSSSLSNSEPICTGRNVIPCGRYFCVGQKLGTEDRLTEYKQGGGKYLEYHFKADVEKYVCAFLNSEGGTLLIGVKDDCSVCGIQICNSKREDQLRLDLDKIMKGFNPNVFPNLYSIKFIPVYSTSITCGAKTTASPSNEIISSRNVVPLSSGNSQPALEPLTTEVLKTHDDTSNEIDQPSFNLSSTTPRKLPPLTTTLQEVTPSSSSNDPPKMLSTTSSNLFSLKTSGQVNHVNSVLSETILKVIEISVQPPVRQSGGQRTLYQNHKREVYIRLDGSVQGPLQASQIVEWGRCNMAESIHLEHDYLKQQVDRKQEEIKMNLKLVDELVKQKQFLENQYQEKENVLTSEIDKLKTREKEMENELEQVKQTKSKVCAIL